MEFKTEHTATCLNMWHDDDRTKNIISYHIRMCACDIAKMWWWIKSGCDIVKIYKTYTFNKYISIYIDRQTKQHGLREHIRNGQFFWLFFVSFGVVLFCSCSCYQWIEMVLQIEQKIITLIMFYPRAMLKS